MLTLTEKGLPGNGPEEVNILTSYSPTTSGMYAQSHSLGAPATTLHSNKPVSVLSSLSSVVSLST